MSFRTAFASRLQEMREQAKEAVNKIELPTKLPTFDDLAAQDEYIHSEDFNVKGQPRNYKKKNICNNDDNNIKSMSDQQGVPDNIDSAKSGSESIGEDTSGQDSLSAGGSSSAWSLLDRPSSNHNVETAREKVEVSTASGELPSTTSATIAVTPQRQNTTESGKNSSTNPVRTPLLSVVTDTLQETPPTVKSTTTTSDDRLNKTRMHNLKITSLMGINSFEKDDDDDDDDDSINEYDPILSLIEKDKFSKPASSSSSSLSEQESRMTRSRTSSSSSIEEGSARISISGRKKTDGHAAKKYRFMEDLERRLETPEEQIETGIEMRVESSSTNSERPYFTRGPFGGAVMNMALKNFNRMMNRPEIADTEHGRTEPSRTPPLARSRNQTPSTKAPEEDYQVTSSASVLDPKDLIELEELKTRNLASGHNSLFIVLATSVQENRHFLFIAFTLLLAIFVYFLTHKNVDDDVT